MVIELHHYIKGYFNHLHGLEKENRNTHTRDLRKFTVPVDSEVVQPKDDTLVVLGGHFVRIQGKLPFIQFQSCLVLAHLKYDIY